MHELTVVLALLIAQSSHEREITLNVATPRDDFQVRVDLTPTSFDYASVKAGGADLRFVESSGTALPYWIEAWDPAGVSTIWVRALHAGTSKFLMRYGDPAAAAGSDGKATFIAFDAFDALDAWTLVGGVSAQLSVADGISSVYLQKGAGNDGAIVLPVEIPDEVYVETRMMVTCQTVWIGLEPIGNPQVYPPRFLPDFDGAGQDAWDGWNGQPQIGGRCPLNTWVRLRIGRQGSTITIKRSYDANEVEQELTGGFGETFNIGFGFQNWGKGTGYVDFVFARRLSDGDPVATVGPDSQLISRLEQIRSGGAGTLIPPGGLAGANSFEPRAVLLGAAAKSYVVEFEVQEAGHPFGVGPLPLRSSNPSPGGSTVGLEISGLAPHTAYHWRARATEAGKPPGGWTSFGANPEVDAEQDFVSSNLAPLGTTPLQVDPMGEAIATGTKFERGHPVTFRVAATDPEQDHVTLSIEVRPLGVPFSGVATATAQPVAAPGMLGLEVEVPFPSSAPESGFHWQWKLVDSYGAASAWTPYGSNAETDADFILVGGSGSGTRCSGSAGATALLLALIVALQIVNGARSSRG